MRILLPYFRLTVLMISLLMSNGCSTDKHKVDTRPTPTPNNIDSSAIVSEPVIKDTVRALDSTLEPGRYVFQSHFGNNFPFDVTTDVDTENTEVHPAKTIALMAAKTNSACDGPEFDGVYRKTVKFTPSHKNIEFGANPKTLLTDLFHSEDAMCGNKSNLKENKREAREDRNVQFDHVFIYTFKRQSDEDYHVIFGTSGDVNTALFFNGEISGISPASTFGRKKLIGARGLFETYFQIGAHCATSYYEHDFRLHPIPVKLSGSLFYDGEHCTNYSANGPQQWHNIKLNSAWEIHPITGIEFLK